MANPFVALDGVDNKGVRAEVWIQKGEGRVDEILPPRTWKPSKGGKWVITDETDRPSNARLVIRNEVLAEGVSGWISTKDPIFEEAIKFHQTGEEVSYRIEWQRNEDLDRTTPVKELRGYDEATGRSDMGKSGRNGVNIFAGLNGLIGREAVTNPAEDEHGRRSALTQAQPAATVAGTGSVGYSDDQVFNALRAAKGVGASDATVGALKAAALLQGVPEGRLAYATNNNRSLSNTYRFVEVARRMLSNLAELNGSEYVEDEKMFSQITAIARVFQEIADNTQTVTFAIPTADRSGEDYGIIVDLLSNIVSNFYPLPFGGSEGEQKLWRGQVTEALTTRLQMVCGLNGSMPTQPQAPSNTTVNDNVTPAAAPVNNVSEEAVEDAAPVDNPGTGGKARGGNADGVKQANTPTVPQPGDDGYREPSSDALDAFHKVAVDAGYGDNPAKVRAYLLSKFGVPTARQVHGPALETLMVWVNRQDNPSDALTKLVESAQ